MVLIRRRCAQFTKQMKERRKQDVEHMIAVRNDKVKDRPSIFENLCPAQTYTVEAPAPNDRVKVARFTPPCTRMALDTRLELSCFASSMLRRAWSFKCEYSVTDYAASLIINSSQ